MTTGSANKNPDAFFIIDQLVASCYRATKSFPAIHQYALVEEIIHAAGLVRVSITESLSAPSAAARKKHYENARDRVTAIDNAFDIALEYGYTNKGNLAELNGYLLGSFKLLSKLINHKTLIESPAPHQI